MKTISIGRPLSRRLVCGALYLGCLALALLPAETFSFTADRVESSMAKGKEKTVLTGRVRISSGTLAIRAERVELQGKDSDRLVCTGSVVADDSDRGIHIETPSLRYDRMDKFSHMEGASILVDRKNKVVLKAQWIENSGQTDITIAQVNVRILKDKLACRSEYALYRRGENLLELSGAPSVYKDGDQYRASRIVVNTDSEEIKLEGEVAGSIQSTDGDKKTDEPGKGQAPAPEKGEPSAENGSGGTAGSGTDPNAATAAGSTAEPASDAGTDSGAGSAAGDQTE